MSGSSLRDALGPPKLRWLRTTSLARDKRRKKAPEKGGGLRRYPESEDFRRSAMSWRGTDLTLF